jgi:uncharacterized integral membrane protein
MGLGFMLLTLLAIALFGGDYAFKRKLKWRWVFLLCAFISGLLITLDVSVNPPTWNLAKGSLYGILFVIATLLHVRKYLKTKFF